MRARVPLKSRCLQILFINHVNNMLLTLRVLDGLLGVLKMLKIQDILIIPSLYQNGVILKVGIP